MGCGKSKPRKEISEIHKVISISTENDKIRSYYQQYQNLLPNRIRELFQKYFIKQNVSPSMIDLKFINLSGTAFHPLTIILPCFRNTRGINLWKTKLGNEGCAALSKLFKHMPHLNFLSLADNKISHLGIRALVDHFSELKELETLELHVNTIDEDSAILLGNNFFRIFNLKILYIDECEFSVKGIFDILSRIHCLKFLEKLSMDYNSFDDSTGDLLLNILNKLKKLKRISLKNTGIKQEIQNSLAVRYPDILFSF